MGIRTLTRNFLCSAAIPLVVAGCSSTPTPPPAPAWIKDPTRVYDNGYIVYVDTGEAPTDELAKFKAEAAALQDLANECSFVPKGTRIEDRYARPSYSLKEAYAKVAVEFEICEQAKHALDPDAVRKLANASFSEEIKRYQDMIGEDSRVALQPMSPGQPVNLPPGSPPPAGYNPNGVVWISSTPTYFAARQQVAFAKQDVILSPPAAYPPGSLQTATYMSSVTAPSQQIQTYAQAHPELKTNPAVWSGVRNQIQQQNRALMGNGNLKTPGTPPAKAAKQKRAGRRYHP